MSELIVSLLTGMSIIILFSIAVSSCSLTFARKEPALRDTGLLCIAVPLLVIPKFLPTADYSLIVYSCVLIYILAVIIPVYANIFSNISNRLFSLFSFLTGTVYTILYITSFDLISKAFSGFLVCIVTLGVVIAIFSKKSKLFSRLELFSIILFICIAGAAYFTESDFALSYLVTALSIPSIMSYGLTLKSQIKSYELLEAKNKQLEDRFEDEIERAVKVRTREIQLAKDRFVEKNKTDHLTGALNRKSFMLVLDDLFLDKRVPNFVMILFDLDNFKTINDTYGHNVGDKCLKKLSNIAKSSIREYDHFVRYGGDEFIIILPNASLRNGLIIADRFRQRVSDETFEPNFTLSIGLAAYPWDGKNFQSLNEVADKGLYAAKSKGRNCVQYAGILKPDSI